MSGLLKAIGYLFSGTGIGISGVAIFLVYMTDAPLVPLLVVALFGFLFILDGAVVGISNSIREHKVWHKKFAEQMYLQGVQRSVMTGFDRYELMKQAG